MLFPSRLVQRFFPIVLLLIVVFFSAVYVYSVPFIKNTVYEIERNASRMVLENVFTLANRMHTDLETYREQALDAHKRQLRVMISMTANALQERFEEAKREGLSQAEAQQSMYEMLRHFRSDNGHYIWVADYQYRLLSHPDSRFHNTDASTLINQEGVAVLPAIVDLAVREGQGFYQYKWNRLNEQQQLDKLSFVQNFPEWGVVIGTGVYLDDVELEVASRREKALEELRESFKELRVARTGYLFIFDARTNMLIHPNPNINGTNIQELKNPVTGQSIAQDLISVADTGEELYYRWDRPDDPGNYIHDKLSLVRYVEGFDWYICSSVYVDELKRSANELSDRVLVMALIALLVAVAMAFFFIYWVTNPIKRLADAAQRVSQGALDTTAGFRRDDELGILAEAFDSMVHRLRDNIENLDLTVRRRTQDLESTNQQLIQTAKEREQAQQRLQWVEAQQRIILDALPALVAFVDADQQLRFVNEPFASAVGQPKAQLTDTPLAACDAVFVHGLAEHFKAIAPFKDEQQVQLAGETRVYRRILTPCQDSQRGVLGTLLLAFDITAERQLEQTLQEAQKMSAVGQLAGGLAHDFNNLLSVILGNLLVVSDQHPDDHQLQRHLKPSIRAARRSAEITHRLLAFARRQSLSPMNCDINVLLQETTELLRSSLPSDVELRYQPTEVSLLPFVDPGRLEDALVNLVLNARDALPSGGKIDIQLSHQTLTEPLQLDETAPVGDYLVIQIRDNGEGFTPQALKMAFEPFYTTRTGGAGSGLGLSMVYGFVKQSNGYIRIQSARNEGALIELWLPGFLQDALSYQSRQTEGQRVLSSGLVLLVEDNDDVRQIVREQLIKQGFNVIESATAEEAQSLSHVLEQVDLLLTDIRLNSSLNGFELAQDFHAYHPDAGIVFMTGYAYDESQQRQNPDNWPVMLKPFDPAQLNAVLAQLAQRLPEKDKVND